MDVLTAFGAFTETVVGSTCRPHILPATSQGGRGPVLELKGLWNPCAVPPDGGCIVPNDLVLGSRSAAHAIGIFTCQSMRPCYSEQTCVMESAHPTLLFPSLIGPLSLYKKL